MKLGWRMNLNSNLELLVRRRIVCGDSGMCTYKQASHKTVESGLRSLSKYENTTFFIQAGCRAEYWTQQLRR